MEDGAEKALALEAAFLNLLTPAGLIALIYTGVKGYPVNAANVTTYSTGSGTGPGGGGCPPKQCPQGQVWDPGQCACVSAGNNFSILLKDSNGAPVVCKCYFVVNGVNYLSTGVVNGAGLYGPMPGPQTTLHIQGLNCPMQTFTGTFSGGTYNLTLNGTAPTC